jgi:hypothetical protein
MPLSTATTGLNEALDVRLVEAEVTGEWRARESDGVLVHAPVPIGGRQDTERLCPLA